MPEQAKVVVTNTTPLIALTAATGNLEVLRVPICKGCWRHVKWKWRSDVDASGSEWARSGEGGSDGQHGAGEYA